MTVAEKNQLHTVPLILCNLLCDVVVFISSSLFLSTYFCMQLSCVSFFVQFLCGLAGQLQQRVGSFSFCIVVQ